MNVENGQIVRWVADAATVRATTTGAPAVTSGAARYVAKYVASAVATCVRPCWSYLRSSPAMATNSYRS
jgi:hypothetical protein